ncbi:extracellular catalytic domain type 2 short-chain-length polyhydroxyalkanoate depolymerase [Roseateles chitinivorans]|uniref:extracellular catalytic domain type 2 short-chain-length polyhydroxyalkanoate depolymerase n=1 Tax=Roseateles chitinivorans TaxID=2917965 RepID=UPI003D676ED4
MKSSVVRSAAIRCFAAATAAAASVLSAGLGHAAVPLPSLNIDRTQITVSGLSSGGFMANQLGYAHSSTFKGIGVFAAGPYNCAGHSNYIACMYNATIPSSALNTMQADLNNWSGTAIDAKSNVASQKVFLFVGLSDTTVGPNPMNAVQTQYLNNGVTAANLEYVQRSGTAHVLPTDFDAAGNNSCGSSASPYIANCGYDGAKAVLTKLYGSLSARNNSPAAANYIEFDQTAFSTNPGLAATGWAYVPATCAAGEVCKLHVALHGCQQNYATIGDKFVRNTGFSRWADTNHIVVLFPQTRVDSISRSTAASGLLPNPNGCWDWVGWYGSNFAQKAGTQIGAIKAMVDKVAGGTTGNPGDPGDPGSPATCFTASNYTHSISGRAYALYGITYANGSNQAMGLWNIFVTTTLKQTAPNYYVIGTCP